MCIGDGKTDEVVFSLLNEIPNSITSTVGKKQTEAQSYISNVEQVSHFLDRLGQEL
jgi:trehalose 6-phosphate synthase/phosphatase